MRTGDVSLVCFRSLAYLSVRCSCLLQDKDIYVRTWIGSMKGEGTLHLAWHTSWNSRNNTKGHKEHHHRLQTPYTWLHTTAGLNTCRIHFTAQVGMYVYMYICTMLIHILPIRMLLLSLEPLCCACTSCYTNTAAIGEAASADETQASERDCPAFKGRVYVCT